MVQHDAQGNVQMIPFLLQTGIGFIFIVVAAASKLQGAFLFRQRQERGGTDWDKVIPIDHGYDESKPEAELTLEDMKGAAAFRGGECLSDTMTQGDWKSRLSFRCAFGHTFEASPRLVLEGGHWCPECERKSWNYGARAKVDPFFAQVWDPLHDPEEMREYPKEVSELDV